MHKSLGVMLAFTLAGCLHHGRGSGGDQVVRVDPEGAGAICAAGGVSIHTGLDRNRNRKLDDGEIDATSVVCNGAPARLDATL